MHLFNISVLFLQMMTSPKRRLRAIDPSQNPSTILSEKQFRQESRLTLVDLNLKNGVYWYLSAVETKYLLMFISYFK